jgi:hypothetical protein
MFTGEYRCLADGVGLFVLPVPVRAMFPPSEEEASRSVVLLKSIERCLWMYLTIVQRMVVPEARLAIPPSRPPAFIITDGRLGVGCTGKPASFHTLDVLRDTLGLFGLCGVVGHNCPARLGGGGGHHCSR